MPAWDALLAFFGVALLVALSPGPDNLFVLVQSIQRGWRVGMCVVLGLCLGIVVHTAAVALGLAAVFAASAMAFTVLKFMGAAYLAWLGCRMLLARPGSQPVLNMQPHHYFRQGALITLLNPKAIVFYMAFFPLFVDPARHQGMLTFGVMAATIAALTMAYGLTVVLLTHHLAERMRANPLIARVLEKVAGVFLIGFGIKLAISK